jgi:CSLREA domain-containing protein
MRKYSGIFSVLAAIVLSVVAASSALAQQTITVNTTLDNGNIACFPRPCPPQCTLRDAITAANDNRPVNGCAAGQSSGVDKIFFNVGSGTPTIRLSGELPPILEPVEINGGTGGATRIEITPGPIFNPSGRRIDGLILAAGDSTIKNLVINGFSGNGIVMTSISGGYLPDHTPPTIPDPSIPTDPPCDIRPTEQNCFPRGPGGGVDPPIPPLEGAGSRNKIFGCFIGTDKTGTIAVGNGSGMNAAGIVDTAGILTDTDMHIIGGPTPEERNVISGNRGHGLILGGKGHLVRGNNIGVNVNGASLGNQFDGIIISGGQFFSAIGTIGASQSPWDGKCQVEIDSAGKVLNDRKDCGNRIAFNGRYGVIMAYNSYEILSNTIFSNGDLGIDIDAFGVTPNAPAGSNRNYPVWTPPFLRVRFLNPPFFGTRVTGSITNRNSGPRIIQVFHNSACDPSGNGEGQELILTFTVPGNGNFNFTIPTTTGFITATSTQWNMWGLKATSEFSACQGI